MRDVPRHIRLLRDWLGSITVKDAAERLGIARPTLSRVLSGVAGISPDMDLRLAKALGTSPGFWYSMQAEHDMQKAQKAFKGEKIRAISMPGGEP